MHSIYREPPDLIDYCTPLLRHSAASALCRPLQLDVPHFRLHTYGRRAFTGSGTLSRILSGSPAGCSGVDRTNVPGKECSDRRVLVRDPAISTICFRHTCSLNTTASGALDVLDDKALYKSIYLLTYLLIRYVRFLPTVILSSDLSTTTFVVQIMQSAACVYVCNNFRTSDLRR